MKTVEMDRDFNYVPHPSQTVAYKKGVRYERVPEAAVNAITVAGAGRVFGGDAAEAETEAETRRGRRG